MYGWKAGRVKRAPPSIRKCDKQRLKPHQRRCVLLIFGRVAVKILLQSTRGNYIELSNYSTNFCPSIDLSMILSCRSCMTIGIFHRVRVLACGDHAQSLDRVRSRLGRQCLGIIRFVDSIPLLLRQARRDFLRFAHRRKVI